VKGLWDDESDGIRWQDCGHDACGSIVGRG
jgi:hypothetical protein